MIWNIGQLSIHMIFDIRQFFIYLLRERSFYRGQANDQTGVGMYVQCSAATGHQGETSLRICHMLPVHISIYVYKHIDRRLLPLVPLVRLL